MIYTVKAVPPGAVDMFGAAVVNSSRCLATPNGVFALNGDEAFNHTAQFWADTITITWPRLVALCNALQQRPLDVGQLASDLAAQYPKSEIDQAMILAALQSDDGQKALTAAALAGAQHAEDS